MRPGLLLALAVVLAGCTASPPPLAQEEPGGPATLGSDDPDGGEGNATGVGADASAPGPVDIVVYLTPDHRLSPTPPEEGTVEDTAGFGDPGFALGSAAFDPWLLDAALSRGQRLVAGRVELVFSTSGPQASGGAAFGFGPAILWYGEEGRLSPSHNIPGPETLLPGEVVRTQAPMMVPPGGRVFEGGAVPAILLGFTYTQSPSNPILVHTGPNGTRLLLTVEPYEPPASASQQQFAFDGAFLYNSLFAPSPMGEDNVRTFPLPLNATPAKLEAAVTGTTTALAQDLDLVLLGPQGEAVWASTSPLADEGLVLYAPNFPGGSGEYALQVQNFQTVQGTFALTVTVHT